ncbi:MAG: hypothetical protein SFY32_10030 [Bacteroidota bacterium]|nr:hypothetical protein [Bacteroidota bacterium]
MSFETLGQEYKLARTIPIKNIDKVSTDIYQNIYLSTEQGVIHKYNSDGERLLTYSPPKVATVSLLEAWNSIKIFVLYRDLQQYIVLDRFLSVLENADIEDVDIGFARVMTLSAQNTFWFFDDSDFSLKKYDQSAHKVISKTPFDLMLPRDKYDINYIREYENGLYLNDKNSGILVFDNFGNYRKKLPFNGLSQFGFLKDELYFIDSDTIRFFNVYNLSQRAKYIPNPEKADKIIANEQGCYLFSQNNMFVLKKNSP